MADTTENPSGDFTADLAALREDVARLADRMTKLVEHQAHSAGQQISESVGDMAQKVSAAAAGAQEGVRTAGREVESCIERHAVTSVLVAFGVGISLGLLSRLRG